MKNLRHMLEELLSRRLLHFGRKGQRGLNHIYAGGNNGIEESASQEH